MGNLALSMSLSAGGGRAPTVDVRTDLVRDPRQRQQWTVKIDENTRDIAISLEGLKPGADVHETTLCIELEFSSGQDTECKFLEVLMVECIPRTP